MTTTLNYVAYAALLTWVTIMIASVVRTQGWTSKGLMLAFGNRDNLPPETPVAGRAERAARNTVDNLLLFTALALTAHAIGADGSQVETGAQVFFWARVAYVPVYLIGIPYLRTAVWTVGIVGLAMILLAIL
ncbi:MAG: MAPEG family protein [Burkholderiales bacterium]